MARRQGRVSSIDLAVPERPPLLPRHEGRDQLGKFDDLADALSSPRASYLRVNLQPDIGCRGTTKVLDDDVEDPGCRCARLRIHGNVRLGLFQTETTPLFDLPARDG